MASTSFLFIMPLAGGNVDILLIEDIDQAIRLRDAAAPIACEIMTQRFRLTDALMSVPLDILQQIIDLACSLAILLHPRIVPKHVQKQEVSCLDENTHQCV